MSPSGQQNVSTGQSRARPEAPSLWRRWKKLWRRLENASAVLRVKRAVRQVAGTELRYFRQLRLPAKHAGGWCFAPDLLSPHSIVYSLGVGEDMQFDLNLVDRFGVTVHAFDPTPAAVSYVEGRTVPEGFVLHRLGIADFDGEAEFCGPRTEEGVCYTLLQRQGSTKASITAQVRRLGTIMAELGHDRIDLLKMDIEGAEYAVLADLVESRVPVGQLLVEFHHRFAGVGQEMTRRAVDLLLENGFRIFDISPSGREYSFVHKPDAVTPA